MSPAKKKKNVRRNETDQRGPFPTAAGCGNIRPPSTGKPHNAHKTSSDYCEPPHKTVQVTPGHSATFSHITCFFPKKLGPRPTETTQKLAKRPNHWPPSHARYTQIHAIPCDTHPLRANSRRRPRAPSTDTSYTIRTTYRQRYAKVHLT